MHLFSAPSTQQLATAKKGPAGAEKLTDNINCVFDKIIEIISHFEGDVVKFAGDAILVIFVRETYEESVTEALKCALTLVNDKHALMVDNDLMQANNRNACVFFWTGGWEELRYERIGVDLYLLLSPCTCATDITYLPYIAC